MVWRCYENEEWEVCGGVQKYQYDRLLVKWSGRNENWIRKRREEKRCMLQQESYDEGELDSSQWNQ